jgi:DSF synthase
MNAHVALAPERSAVRGSPNPYQLREPQPFETIFDASLETLWCFRAATASRSVTMSQLRETRAVDEKLAAGSFGAVKFKLLGSRQVGTFCLGGDLAFFASCIERRDRSSLAEYAALAAKAIWANVCGSPPRGPRTVALVQGEAQGGGFEAALSCNTLIAEEGTSFGFPEPLFGMFPGMGGQLLLETRLDHSVAARMVSESNRYPAALLHQIGVVDYLCPRGEGLQFATELLTEIRERPDGDAAKRMELRQELLDALDYGVLAGSIDRWVEQAFTLDARHLRSMRYIMEMQQRKS